MAPSSPQRLPGQQQALRGSPGRVDVFFITTPPKSANSKEYFTPKQASETPRLRELCSPMASPKRRGRTPLHSQQAHFKRYLETAPNSISKALGSAISTSSGNSCAISISTVPSPRPGASPNSPKHRIARQPPKLRLQCAECRSSFTEVAYLLRHYRALHMKSEYPCPFPNCKWVYLSWDPYVDHCTLDHGKKPDTYICEYEGCSRLFRTWRVFVQHLGDHAYFAKLTTSEASGCVKDEANANEDERSRSSRFSFSPEIRTLSTASTTASDADPAIKQEAEFPVSSSSTPSTTPSVEGSPARLTPATLDFARQYQEQYPVYEKLHAEVVDMISTGGEMDFEKCSR